MTSSVFLDTSGWIAILNSVDSQHLIAQDTWRELANRGCRFVVTDWIIAETGNGLSRSLMRGRFVEVVQQMLEAPSVEIVAICDDLLRRALAEYAKFADKSWGLVDCASFIVMRERGITEAFTCDRHFDQAGFECLLPTL
jgi:predicted nucleic acid-binding protein